MPSKKSAIVLIAAIVLFANSCTTNRQATARTQTNRTVESSDTLHEHVVVTVMDTIREVTTITVRENEAGDTLRMTTITDRTRASTKDRYHDVKEKLIVRTDTVYLEKEVDKQVAIAAGPNVEIDKDGNITKQVNRTAQTLKWVFLIVASVTILLIVIKFFKH